MTQVKRQRETALELPLLQGWRLLLLSLVILPLFACSSHDMSQYQGLTPSLDMRAFFNGPLEATGMVVDRGGQVTRRFTVTMIGRWEGNVGTLDEQFFWDDGEQSERIWTLTDLGDGRLKGEAADVEGFAEGRVSGPVLHWSYDLRLPEDQGGWLIHFDDTMALVTEKELMNVAVMTKWGIEVGRVIISIRRL
ncbi:DUF3833 domain-containing protein [Ferrimonas gelatinilytica]